VLRSFTPGSRADAEFREAALACLDGLYGFALTLTHDRAAAEDLVQETYVRALAARRKAPPEENLRAWFFVILRNVWRNERRRRRPEGDDEDIAQLASGDDPAQALERQRTRQRLQDAIHELPAAFREVLVLRHVEEMSYRDIARIVGCPAGTVMSRLARARGLLRRSLGPVALPARREGRG
jgi:RNA polymerase sigma-70 factor (ECF subfamily)